MPTSTRPFEILFDLTNDTNVEIMFEMTSQSGRRIPSSILLGSGKSVSLVLEAGSTYNYTLQTSKRVWQISVKSWQDLSLIMSSVLSGSIPPSTLSGGISCSSW
ncbi:hypothetical protein BDP27DRAFT_1326042 [Rhodocollybia butyracea]|uniref:Uncharacterized protein n=1 Tax=Rhodocollybia butyracea TaxID=206335 RepID=A0A9P5U7R7_9AGAR|nr:hypothetical protein BDP27DRAFT_1326042 [Rhodocollybia butyracea]